MFLPADSTQCHNLLACMIGNQVHYIVFALPEYDQSDYGISPSGNVQVYFNKTMEMRFYTFHVGVREDSALWDTRIRVKN
jgi:hypothetical protein